MISYLSLSHNCGNVCLLTMLNCFKRSFVWVILILCNWEMRKEENSGRPQVIESPPLLSVNPPPKVKSSSNKESTIMKTKIKSKRLHLLSLSLPHLNVSINLLLHLLLPLPLRRPRRRMLSSSALRLWALQESLSPLHLRRTPALLLRPTRVPTHQLRPHRFTRVDYLTSDLPTPPTQPGRQNHDPCPLRPMEQHVPRGSIH